MKITYNNTQTQILASSQPTVQSPQITIRYADVPANLIFGMVGRCGGGYNTVWEDWSHEGRESREAIMKEFEEELDKKCGHYKKLEESILQEGFRNPLIITCGFPLIRKLHHLPPEMRTRPVQTLLLLEGTTGGSRLHVAQKHNMNVPCLINDRVGFFNTCPLIETAVQAKTHYADPVALNITKYKGLIELYDRFKTMHHLPHTFWDSMTMDNIRAPIWYNAMIKHGYKIQLPPHLMRIINDENRTQSKSI